MSPSNDVSPKQMVGKRVVFNEDSEHHSCWHYQVGLKGGVVLRLGQSLAQKAEILGSSELLSPEILSAEREAVRVWIKADPCPAFARGCEAAVDADCVRLADANPDLTNGEKG